MRVMEVYEAGSANQDEEGAKRCLWSSQFKQHPYGTATQQTCSSDRVARSRRMPFVAGDLPIKPDARYRRSHARPPKARCTTAPTTQIAGKLKLL